MSEERIMQGDTDCGPKDENMTEIGKLAVRIDGYVADLARRLPKTLTDPIKANLEAITHCAASIQHWTNYENKCTACTLSRMMLDGLESRNKCIKRLRGEIALLEKTGMERLNELGKRYRRIKELEAELEPQRSEP